MRIPHVGFAAPSGSGKTTLIARLVPLLRARGLRLGYLKHAHHGFDLDTPGKDSFLLREAGATAVLIASGQRWALMQEGLPESGEPGQGCFDALLDRFDPVTTDLILVEGWHGARFPRIGVHRPASGRVLADLDDPDLIAVATDAPEQLRLEVPLLPLGEPERIAELILGHPRIGLAGCVSAVGNSGGELRGELGGELGGVARGPDGPGADGVDASAADALDAELRRAGQHKEP